MFSIHQIVHYKPPTQHYLMQQLKQNALNEKKAIASSKRPPFHGMMIDRIQNLRPGCGSCGH
jgi:hypothetical protein